jgi:hypothetical protein
MATMKKAQNSAKVVAKKTTVKVTPKVTPKVKKTNNDVKMYNIKGKILSGEGNDAMDQNYNMLKKNGGKVKKAANGTSLGMKSVKAGFDKNPGVTRADIITAAKGKAKSGAKMKMGGKIKKAQEGTMAAKMVGGALEPSAARIKSLQQKTAENVKKINMSSAADSMKKNMEGAAKSGGSMKKCKYGCK